MKKELAKRLADLSKKYTPEVLSAGALYCSAFEMANAVREYNETSPEEREKKLYESLKKKYEEG